MVTWCIARSGTSAFFWASEIYFLQAILLGIMEYALLLNPKPLDTYAHTLFFGLFQEVKTETRKRLEHGRSVLRSRFGYNQWLLCATHKTDTKSRLDLRPPVLWQRSVMSMRKEVGPFGKRASELNDGIQSSSVERLTRNVSYLHLNGSLSLLFSLKTL